VKTGRRFPLGREYKVFVYNTRLLAYEYYWEGEDRVKALMPAEAIEWAKSSRQPQFATDRRSRPESSLAVR